VGLSGVFYFHLPRLRYLLLEVSLTLLQRCWARELRMGLMR